MNFLIRVSTKKSRGLQVFFSEPPIPDIPDHESVGTGNPAIYFMDAKLGENFRHLQFDRGQTNIFILGDLVIPVNYRPSGRAKESFYREFFQHFTPAKLRDLKGFFYVIQVDSPGGSLKVYSSLFNILPVYYFRGAGYCWIASAVEVIRRTCPFPFTINKKFLLEKLLFNYALFNDTIIKEIHLLAANSYLELSELGDPGYLGHLGDRPEIRMAIKKHTGIADYFLSDPASPVPWEKSLPGISALYLEMIRDYFPDERCYMTLTGGFDGRTNVAAALKYCKDFAAFSYGCAGTPDILIPQKISEKLGIRYRPFLLSECYRRNEFLPHALQLVAQTDANAGISRAHYRYIAQEVAHKSQYIITGNFGSELLRSMNTLGVMVSPQLFNIFSEVDHCELIQGLVNDANLRFLELENFKNELDELSTEIIQYRKNFQSSCTLNQNFYVYMFEEVFRKYFGPEVILQNSCYLYNRSPYLDFNFIRPLLKTGLAGVNNSFWENNPLVRFRGQVLSAYIIREAYPPLAEIATDRLYKPQDFFSLAGKIHIAASFLRRKYINKPPLHSPTYNRECYQAHMDYFKQLAINTGFFNKKCVQDFLSTGQWQNEQDLFSHLMSLIIYTK